MEKLHSLSLFVNLLPAELAIVDEMLHERHYIKDEVIFDEGEEGKALYIVADGEVLVCRQGAPDSGRIATLGAGTFFGELALLDDAPRSAQVRAAKNSDLIVFFRDDFVSLLDTHSRIASKVARQLARHIGARMRELALKVGAHQHL